VKFLVTGAGGMLARAVLHELNVCGHASVACTRADLDITSADAVTQTVASVRPDVVIQCAGYTAVDAAETDESGAIAVNALGTANVARACIAAGARLVYPGTDYVFDGMASVPYGPDHPTAPIGAYGRSKLAGERAAAAAGALVVRTSWLYGRGGRSFVRTIADRARSGGLLRVVDDQRGAPTATPDLARMIVRLVEQRAPAGVYHATNAGHTTWHGLAQATLEIAGIPAMVERISSAEIATAAVRPAYSVLDCSATYALTGPAPDWRDALAREIDEGLLDA
jgi:dTDP-4-dehydrorhamnose reductase